MKKHLFYLIGLFAATIFATRVNAQDKTLPDNLNLENATDHSAKTAVNPLVQIKFHKEFPGVTNDVWAESKNSFKVWFNIKDIQYLVFLDKKGNYISQLRSYTEKHLPADVRKQVRSTYYDYAIRYVKEVNSKNVTAYFVTLEDETSWKVIRIIDGEMEIWKEYNKEKSSGE